MPEATEQSSTTTATTETVETSGKLGPDGKPFDPDRAMRTIENLRGFEKQATEQQKMIADLEAKIREHEDAKLSETEKLQNRLSELESERSVWERERQELRVGILIEQAAAKAGAAHPDSIPRLIDLADVQYNRDGTPKNIDQLIDKAREQYPSYFGRQSGSFDGGVRGTSTDASPDEIFGAILRGEHVT